MAEVAVAAVDLGASSGRVMLGRAGPGLLELTEEHRFANAPVRLPTGLHWDAVGLFREVLAGLRQAARTAAGGTGLRSVGIDSWAVDYGLVDRDGGLAGVPYAYRDERCAAGVERVHALVPPEVLYARNGLQFLPFTTLYQLAAEAGTARHEVADTMLLVPDLLTYWLTGHRGAEITNASTTGLLDVHDHTWSTALAGELGIPARLLPPLHPPGTPIGPVLPSVAAGALPSSTLVTAVGSHDTASAVVAVPAEGERFAYISCGTWSLVGLELAAPVLTPQSRAANFTNELGVDGRTRYLRNVMGLWLISECLRTWREQGRPEDLAALLAQAARLPAGGPVIDPDESVFLPPGDMPARIEAECRRRGERVPADRPALVRCILDSLAAAYARAVADAVRVSGRDVDVVHVVGGGSRNELLCRLTAQACGLPVVAGPAEATALGNVLVQARSLGALAGDLDDLRALVRATTRTRRHVPQPV